MIKTYSVIAVVVLFTAAALIMALPTLDPSKYAPPDCITWTKFVKGVNCTFDPLECNYTRPCYCAFQDSTTICTRANGRLDKGYFSYGLLVIFLAIPLVISCIIIINKIGAERDD